MPDNYLNNNWIMFLRQYGPIPRNDNMYDESIQRMLHRTTVQPIDFPAPYLGELNENFRSAAPDSVILTGTAGDGKTFLCRRVWEDLGGDARAWEGNEKIHRLPLSSGYRLTVVKDLSELRDQDRAILRQMSDAVCGEGGREEVFLVAANDGQLVEAWNEALDSSTVVDVRALIEDLLVMKQVRREGRALRLYNLSCTSAAQMLDAVIDAVVNHPGWTACSGCLGQAASHEQRCPIWENYMRLQQPLFRERLRNLLRLCDQNEYHLPIRQLLLLASNILLGHPGAKDRLLRCGDIPGIFAEGRRALASPYGNVFGENLTVSRRDSTEVFEVLNRFGLGEETTNRIDSILIYGADDDSLKPLFDSLVQSDPIYGATERYLALQSAYMEGQELEESEEFLRMLRMQRQRLFFTIPADRADGMRLWDLTVFQFAGEYLNDVYAVLGRGQRPTRAIAHRLVRGLNRIFTGMLTTTDRQIVLATSGSYSQARVSRIEEAYMEVEPKLGQKVALELHNDRVHLVVYIASSVAPSLPLHLVRYEFLSRVAEGALPSSFSRECYEDLLAFKSRLLRDFQMVQQSFGEVPDASDMNLKLLQLDSRGFVHTHSIDLRL